MDTSSCKLGCIWDKVLFFASVEAIYPIMTIDNHVHFTGSLPVDFVKCLAQKRNVEWKGLLPYGSDKKENYKRFFKNYSYVQSIIKPRNVDEMWETYCLGTFEICKQAIQEGVQRIDIIAGAHKDLHYFRNRLENMVKGIQKAKSLSSQFQCFLRITFIRDEFGQYRNYSTDIFEKLVEMTNRFSDVISGFDFSGEESPNDSDLLFYIAEYINSHRRISGRTYEISAHCGENITGFTVDDHLKFIQRLINSPIDTLCHGTILWLPLNAIAMGKHHLELRNTLLTDIAQSKKKLEICPTANLIMTPLKRYEDIPIQMFDEIGLNYSINTDNKLLFQTNISQELAALGLNT